MCIPTNWDESIVFNTKISSNIIWWRWKIVNWNWFGSTTVCYERRNRIKSSTVYLRERGCVSNISNELYFVFVSTALTDFTFKKKSSMIRLRIYYNSHTHICRQHMVTQFINLIVLTNDYGQDTPTWVGFQSVVKFIFHFV